MARPLGELGQLAAVTGQAGPPLERTAPVPFVGGVAMTERRRVVRAREAKKKLEDPGPPIRPPAGSGLPVPGPSPNPQEEFWEAATELVRELTTLVRFVREQEGEK